MQEKRKIILPFGQISKLAELTGVGEATCSKYLRLLYDPTNAEVSERAEKVRQTAVEQCGGVYAQEQ